MPRIGYVMRYPQSGSRYKYAQMFQRAAEVEVISPDADFSQFDLVIVEGDKCKDYQRALSAKVRYLLVEQDSATIRYGREWPTEREMLERASAVLLTSEAHAEHLSLTNDLPYHEVVHLRPFASDLQYERKPKMRGKHMVYSGGIVTPENAHGPYGYRAYHDIFAAFQALGWTVHIYPAWGGADRRSTYAGMGCVVHDEVPQSELYRELSQYRFGFQGYATTGPQDYLRICRPNKLWEYLASGIPTVGYNTGGGSAVYEGKWGEVAPTLDALPSAIERALKLRLPDASTEVIDNDLPKFARLIDEALSAPMMRKRSFALGVPVEFEGRIWQKGEQVTYNTALAMKAAGVIQGKGLPDA